MLVVQGSVFYSSLNILNKEYIKNGGWLCGHNTSTLFTYVHYRDKDFPLSGALISNKLNKIQSPLYTHTVTLSRNSISTSSSDYQRSANTHACTHTHTRYIVFFKSSIAVGMKVLARACMHPSAQYNYMLLLTFYTKNLVQVKKKLWKTILTIFTHISPNSMFIFIKY